MIKFYINDYPFILLETYKLFGVKILCQVCKTILDYKYRYSHYDKKYKIKERKIML